MISDAITDVRGYRCANLKYSVVTMASTGAPSSNGQACPP